MDNTTKEKVDKYLTDYFQLILDAKNKNEVKWKDITSNIDKDIDPEYVRGRFRKLEKKKVVRFSFPIIKNEYKEVRKSDGEVEITDTVDRKLTDEELYERYGRDKEGWRISMVWFKDTQNGFKLSVCFVPIKKALEINNLQEKFTKFIDSYNIKILKNEKPKVNKYSGDRKCMYLCTLSDLHIGNFQKPDYLYIIKERILETFNTILDADIKKVVILNTGDLIHSDNSKGTTWKGTQLDSQLSYEDSFTQALDLTTTLIDYAASIVSEVTFINVRGNHSFDTEYCLGEALKRIYKEQQNVEIINQRETRIYYYWENNAFLFTHGDKSVDRLPLVFATEGKEIFNKAENHHIMLGHLHHNKSKQFVNDRHEFTGIEVRVLGSPSSSDNWHKTEGYVQNKKSLLSFLFTPEEGKLAEYSFKL